MITQKIERIKRICGSICIASGLFTVFAAIGTVDFYDQMVRNHGTSAAGEDPFGGMIMLAALGLWLTLCGAKLLK